MIKRNKQGKFIKGHRGYKSMLGKKHTREARENMSKASKGKKKPWISKLFKGRKLTEEHKKNISKAMKGKPFSGKPWSWKGKKLSKEHRGKMSETRKGKPHLNQRGANCHFWKGGVTPKNMKIRKSIEHRLWSESVFARDNYTCQKYGIRGGKLHSHHIKNFAKYSELRFAIDNGITFSEKAHDEFHKRYGIKNNNETQLKKFLREEVGK